MLLVFRGQAIWMNLYCRSQELQGIFFLTLFYCRLLLPGVHWELFVLFKNVLKCCSWCFFLNQVRLSIVQSSPYAHLHVCLFRSTATILTHRSWKNASCCIAHTVQLTNTAQKAGPGSGLKPWPPQALRNV